MDCRGRLQPLLSFALLAVALLVSEEHQLSDQVMLRVSCLDCVRLQGCTALLQYSTSAGVFCRCRRACLKLPLNQASRAEAAEPAAATDGGAAQQDLRAATTSPWAWLRWRSCKLLMRHAHCPCMPSLTKHDERMMLHKMTCSSIQKMQRTDALAGGLKGKRAVRLEQVA